MRSYIFGDYQDFFLDLQQLYEEINDAQVLSDVIKKSLKKYNLSISDIISCTTDNCNLMQKTAECLNIWRIPCLLHIFK